MEIYTDGACINNPGPGGWGVVILNEGQARRLSGSVQDTTSQQMELLAAAKGLSALKNDSQVTLYSDSAYLINAFQQNWLDSWRKNNWQKGSGDPLQNKFLWLWLDSLTHKHKVEFKKVKAHSGVKWNEEVDDLARKEAQSIATGSQPQTDNREVYKDKLKTKAEEFIEVLSTAGFQAGIKDIFKYQLTLYLERDNRDYGNLRIYYKPSNKTYKLGFQELKEESVVEEVKDLWLEVTAK